VNWGSHPYNGPPVDEPLAGTNIYVTIDDLREYRDAIVAFWDQLSAALADAAS